MARTRSIGWRRLPSPREPGAGAQEAATPIERGLRRSLEVAGIPVVAGSPEEEALVLLEVAAEIEHSLMVAYLYAFFSCETSSFGAVLRLVAVQEMGHLITVQNLRLLLGGQPYMGRSDQSPQPEQDPFPFRLERVSLDSLAKYAVTEMPAPDVIPAGLQEIVREVRDRVEASLGTAVHRVGALYAKLYWLFMADDTSVGPWADFPAAVFAEMEAGRHIQTFSGAAGVSFQADSAEWSIGGDDVIVEVCGDRPQALQSLLRIAAQGEGLSSETDSHFEIFAKAYQDLKMGGVRVHPVPVNPSTTADGSGTPLANPVAARLSELLDASYDLLVLEILLSFTLEKGGPWSATRKALIDETLRDMKTCIKRVANHLAARVPLQPGQPAGATPRAGAAFTAPAVPGTTTPELVRAFLDAVGVFEERIAALDGTQGLDAVVRVWLQQFRSLAQGKRQLGEALGQV